MSATLIAVVLTLVLGHAVPSLASLRRFDWLLEWRRHVGGLGESDGALRGRAGLALIIALPVLVIGLLQIALREPMYGLPGFGFAVLLLFYCWGPRDLDQDVERVIDAAGAQAKREVAAVFLPSGSPQTLDGPALVEGVFDSALHRWFGPLFWFLLLGPVGALLYRIGALLALDDAHADMPSEQRESARWLQRVLDWPVAQLMTLALALVAHFDAVLGAWRAWHAGGMRLDSGFLGAAARASVEFEVAEDEAYATDDQGTLAAPALLELRDAMSLVWRMLLLWLAVLGLFVIAGFVS
jgi:AmpE protein